MIFSVPRGCMIFCPERSRDFFGPNRLSDFFVLRGCMIFFPSREVGCFFCLLDFCLFLESQILILRINKTKVICANFLNFVCD